MKKINARIGIWGVLLGLSLGGGLGWTSARAQETQIDVDREAAYRRLVKVAISGFTGETLAALKFDLDVAGFTNTTPESAQFLISGKNSERLEGTVTDRISKSVVLAKAYTGGTARSQAHAFADDIVEKVTGRKGIAQTKIAFRVMRGDVGEIYLADYDGYNAVAVTRDNSLVAAPTWVPGRRTLYYTSYKLGNPDVYSHDLDTGNRQIVARYTGLNTSAAISPDGRQVALVLSKSGSPDIYVADASGGNLRQLTHTKEDESSPCWSPDGRTLCFASRVSGRAALYTMPASGGQMRRLTTVGVINTTEPDWSPDGESIVFTSLMGSFQICVLKVKTGETTILAAGEDPTWAPNSRTVIFTRRSRPNSILSLLDVPTKRIKDIAQVSGSSSQPSWAK